MGFTSWKHKYNKKYGYAKNKSHSLKDISKKTGVSMKGLQQIYDKGIGAYKTNPESVRPTVKSKEQWAMARVYSAVMGGKTAKIDAEELKMETGGGLRGIKITKKGGRTYPLAPRDVWYGDADYESRGGRLVYMTPDEFLGKVKPLEIDESSRDNIDDLKTHILRGRKLDPLQIYSLDANDPKGHDGRHRAYASKELGINQVPVIDFASKKQGGQTSAQQEKVAKVMGEFKDGKLKTSHGKKVTDRDQAIAIALSEAGIPKKYYRGGDIEDYNKWKGIDWDSLPYGNQKKKLFRLLSWIESGRLVIEKLPEEKREILEYVRDEMYNHEKLKDIYESHLSDYKWEYDNAKGKEDKQVVLDSLKSLKLTEADISTHKDEIDYAALAEKIVDRIDDEVEFYTVDDHSFDRLAMVLDYHEIDEVVDLYDDILDNHGEAVYTEEAEEIQYDLFGEKEMPKQTTEEKNSDIDVSDEDLEQLIRGLKAQIPYSNGKEKKDLEQLIRGLKAML